MTDQSEAQEVMPEQASGEQAESWRAGLPEGLRDHPSLARMDSVEALGKSYINAEKMRTPDESQPGNNDGFDDPTQKIATELKLVDAFKTHEVLDLPVYHQYFFLGGEGVNRR